MPTYTAKTADKFKLYQDAVQSAEAEVQFVDRLYRKYYGATPTLFREDFCGTALISCEWVKRRRENHAYGVDLCKDTLDYGRKHNIAKLKPDAAARLHLLQQNVLHVRKPKMHVVGAFNYSYFIFKERDVLLQYFCGVRASLQRNGLFLLDAYGGYESQQVMKEEQKKRSYTYVWDQAKYNPINDHTLCHIHFKFPDGTMLKNAFTYDWRLWSLGGICDVLSDAGFSRSEVYWEGTTKRGNGNGVFRPTRSGENTSGWNAYIAALP